MELLKIPVLDGLAVAALTFTAALVSLVGFILCAYLWIMADLSKRLDYFGDCTLLSQAKSAVGRREDLVPT